MSIVRHRKVDSNQKGNAIIEFTLIIVLLLGLLFAIVDLSLMLFANLAMQHAVRSGARYAVTGREDIYPGNRRSAVIQKIKDSSIGFCNKNPCTVAFYKLNSDGSISTIPADPDNPQSGDVGNPSEIIVVAVEDYSWSLMTPLIRPFFPDGKYTFTVKATMRNEPFPVGG